MLEDCDWLPAMRNLRSVNAFCFLFYGTDRSRCETAVTSTWIPGGPKNDTVCTDVTRCLWSRCMWVQIDPGRPGHCVGGDLFGCARDLSNVNGSFSLIGRDDRFKPRASMPQDLLAGDGEANAANDSTTGVFLDSALLDSLLDG